MSIGRAISMGFFLASIGHLAIAQDETVESDQTDQRVCVNTRAVRSFDAITDQFVYVKEGSSKHYLFTMRNRCHNLRDAMGIAIKDTTSRVCSDGFGEIVYRDRMAGGRSLESCRIDTIEQVESKDEAKAIVEARTKKNDEE